MALIWTRYGCLVVDLGEEQVEREERKPAPRAILIKDAKWKGKYTRKVKESEREKGKVERKVASTGNRAGNTKEEPHGARSRKEKKCKERGRTADPWDGGYKRRRVRREVPAGSTGEPRPNLEARSTQTGPTTGLQK